MTVLAAIFAIHGMQSLVRGVLLLPMWIHGVHRHQYGSGSYAGFAIVSAVCALAAAYGLGRRRRWTWIPMLVVVALAAAEVCLVAAFGLGGAGTARARVVVAVLLVGAAVVAAWLLRYVWRHTRSPQ